MVDDGIVQMAHQVGTFERRAHVSDLSRIRARWLRGVKPNSTSSKRSCDKYAAVSGSPLSAAASNLHKTARPALKDGCQ